MNLYYRDEKKGMDKADHILTIYKGIEELRDTWILTLKNNRIPDQDDNQALAKELHRSLEYRA